MEGYCDHIGGFNVLLDILINHCWAFIEGAWLAIINLAKVGRTGLYELVRVAIEEIFSRWIKQIIEKCSELETRLSSYVIFKNYG